MLSITFPLIVAFAEGFVFWPLKNEQIINPAIK